MSEPYMPSENTTMPDAPRLMPWKDLARIPPVVPVQGRTSEIAGYRVPQLPYRPSRADPEKAGRFICTCGNSPDCPTLNDHLWYDQIGLRQDDLRCILCVEDILGRRLELEDLRPCLEGNMLAYFYERGRESALQSIKDATNV